MILELVAGVTTVVLASLWYADRALEREERDPRLELVRATFAERRRVLERERQWWASAASTSPGHTAKAEGYDRELLALAEEERKALIDVT